MPGPSNQQKTRARRSSLQSRAGREAGQTKSDGLRVDEARRAMRRFFVGLETGLTGCLTERPTAQTVTALGMDRVNK